MIYKINDTWLIEYFLNKQAWNLGIMTGAIVAIVRNMQAQGINNIGALVDRRNLASIRVLEKAGFTKAKHFDLRQDYYEL